MRHFTIEANDASPISDFAIDVREYDDSSLAIINRKIISGTIAIDIYERIKSLLREEN